jgi:hypothetical protein
MTNLTCLLGERRNGVVTAAAGSLVVMVTSTKPESTDQLKSSLRMREGSGIIFQKAGCIQKPSNYT